MKKAFITGISGQDGSYLSKFLLEKGYHVIGITRDLVNLNEKNLEYLNIKNDVEIIESKTLDVSEFNKLIKYNKPTEFYNLAAQSSVGLSFKEPYETLNFNITSVLNWLEAIRLSGINIKFYQASSSEMFGNIKLENLPITEDNIFNPASPYGISKAAAHWLVNNYREANKLFCSCGILFNHESCLRGPNYVIKKIINHALKLKMGLTTDKLKLGNLNIKRDWGYAPKYVEAMWKMLQVNEADDYLICSGNVIELRELVKLIFNKLDLSFSQFIKIDEELFRPVDLETIYGDNSKAKLKLNWQYDYNSNELVDLLIQDEIKFIEWNLIK